MRAWLWPRFLLAAVTVGSAAAHAQTPDDTGTSSGRDFPKTLTLDEPGIDDEMSLPTASRIRQGAGAQTALAFEIDKRITERLDVQVNGGWQSDAAADGWQDFELTTKYVALSRPATETLLTVGITRLLGHSGALRIGAAPVSGTVPTLYLGQGFGATALPAALRPFAITATLGYLVPDRPRAAGVSLPQQLQLGASVQYSLGTLAPLIGAAGWPDVAARLIPIVEFTYNAPTTDSAGSDARQGYLAPGVIYAGDGYQLAAEALLPLTQASGNGVGVIAQLNVSFRILELGRLARPLF